MSGWLGFGSGDLTEHGLRRSDAQPAETLSTWADDVREILRAERLEAPLAVGLSQGAPFALMLAAWRLVEAAAIVSGQDLPGRYGTKSTCHRRFQQWVDAGVFEQILKTLVEDLRERGGLDLSECFVDATFASGKKGDSVSAPPAGAKAARSWQWQTALVFLSPSTLNLLRRRRSDLLTLYSSGALSLLSRSD